MATRFLTERLIIRDYKLDDAPSAFDMYRRPEVHEHLLRQPAPSLEFMADRISEHIAEWSARQYGFWAVEEKGTGRFVGSCILKPLPADDRFEVGWHVHPELQGRGYATEFGSGAIKYAFGKLDLDAVYAILRPENMASKRVAEKLGMRFLEITGRYHNLELAFYGVVREEAALRHCGTTSQAEVANVAVPTNNELRDHAMEVLSDALRRYPLARPVELEFRPLRVTAGRAQFDRNRIVLSSIVLRDYDSVTTTLLHEYAHLMAYERGGRLGRGHGPMWKEAMRALGLEPQVYHRYQVRRNERRQVVFYRCRKCGSTFERHRRLPKRGRYVHAMCGGELEFCGRADREAE